MLQMRKRHEIWPEIMHAIRSRRAYVPSTSTREREAPRPTSRTQLHER